MYNLDTLYWDRYSLYLDYLKLINRFDRDLRKCNVSAETYKIFMKQVAILKTQNKNERYSEKENIKTVKQIPNKILDTILDSFIELNVDGIKNIDIYNKFNKELEISKECIKNIDNFALLLADNCNDVDLHVRFIDHWNNIKKASLSLIHNYDTTHGVMLSNLFNIDNKQDEFENFEKPVLTAKDKKIRLQQARAKVAAREKN